jgi:hypothetical protein
MVKKMLSLVLAVAFLCVVPFSAFAADQPTLDVQPNIEKAANSLLKLEKQKEGQVLSPWSYIALAAADKSLKGTQVQRVCELIRDDNAFKSGEVNKYCLLVLTLLSAGLDPCDYQGEDLIAALRQAQLPDGQFADFISGTGEDLVNAHIWSLLALTAAGEPIPNSEQALQWLVDQQHEDGSFYWYAKDKEVSDVDSTGMALQALGALGVTEENSTVKKAVRFLQSVQNDQGGFMSWDAENSESCSTVIQGLISVGIDPTGPEFSKPQGNPVTALLSFQLADGSFEHIKGNGPDEIATYHALLALTDYARGESFCTRLAGRQVDQTEQEDSSGPKELIKFKLGEKSYTVLSEGRETVQAMDVAPFVSSGRTFVPIRFLANALGIHNEDINWDSEKNMVTLMLDQTTVNLTIGSKELIVNGETTLMDVSPIAKDGRTFLPARYVAEAFGYQVDWDPQFPLDVNIAR